MIRVFVIRKFVLSYFKKKMKILKNILLYIWQFPQNIVGLLFLLFLKPTELVKDTGYAKVYKSGKISGGISLGEYAFVSKLL